MPSEELLAGLHIRYFEFNELNEIHSTPKRAANKKVLDEALTVIDRGLPIAQWESSFCSRFLNMVCNLGRQDAQKLSATEGADAEKIQAIKNRADWACSFAVATVNQVDGPAKEQACGLWFMSRIVAELPKDPENFIRDAVKMLAPVGLPEAELVRQAKAQVVMNIARRTNANDDAVPLIETARAWCRELVALPQFNRFLSRAAGNLGIEIPILERPAVSEQKSSKEPESDLTASDSSQPSTKDGEPRTKEPQVWKSPEAGTEKEAREEFQRCLLKLLALSRESNSPLTPFTAGQISKDLKPNSEFARWAAPLHFATRDLWKAYWSRGDKLSLELARRLALLSYRGATIWGTQDRERANALHLWMCTRLPEFIRTCDLAILLEDASLLCANLKCGPGDLQLREGVVEAHAGECRCLRAAGETDDAATLLRENADSLKLIHDDYRQRTGGKPREDELNAWAYLFPPPAEPAKPVQLPPQSASSILQDTGFLEVAKNGSYESIREFVEVRLQDIQELLKRRLDVRLAPEHVMMPEGTIYADSAAKKKQHNPQFVDACEKLKNGEFARAAAVFERLARTLQKRPRDICRDYQAYAQARQLEPVLARGTLMDLPATGYRYPSAYWNLACCIASEQNDHRLDVLVAGLENAPNWNLLRGVVYLALLLDDEKRLRDWLPCLTFTEARLLSYHLQYADMDRAARERAVVQLGRYRAYSEPEVPDPSEFRLRTDKIVRFIDALMELHQEPTIDFWLRCREWIGRNQHDYWQIRADFLVRSERPRIEAAQARREELRCRLYVIETKESQEWFANDTRKCIEDGLRLCMTPDLRNIGHDIFNTVDQFDKKYPDFKPLLPRTPHIRRFYEDNVLGSGTGPRSDGQSSAPGKNPTVESGTEVGVKPSPSIDLDTLLAQAGAECHARLHDVAHLPALRSRLEEVASGLQKHQRPDSAAALERLLQEWKTFDQHADKEKRQAGLQRAKTAYAEFHGRLQRDLTPAQLLMAGQLLSSLVRVNDRLARDLDLLPRMTVEGPASVDLSATATAFALFVRCEAGTEPAGPPVRMQGAVATLDDGETEFPLRDKLGEVTTMVSVGQGALLTFSFVRFRGPREGRSVRLTLTYEFAGSSYKPEQFSIPLVFTNCPAFPSHSPYIFGRSLEPNEIEGHFFGREKEQELILESVRDGQQKTRYVEGIRRTGKSSLLRSIEYEIGRQHLPLIPVYWSTTTTANCDHAGRILFNLLDAIAKHEKLASARLGVPTEVRCCENLPQAFAEFTRDLASKLPEQRVLMLVDDFQVLAEIGNAAQRSNPTLHTSIIGFLNLIYGNANPHARLLWLFAGQLAFRKFRVLLPGPLYWGTIKAIPIDFLGVNAIGEILQTPLASIGARVPQETVLRVHSHTAGHPEVVQQLAELMLERAREEKRLILTPADADAAAHDLADYSDTFADTWYPMAELTQDQRTLMAEFVAVVPPGSRIEPHRLVLRNQVTEAHKTALDDLAARKIIDVGEDGTIGIKAYVLDLWLHRAVPRMIQDRSNGTVAIFIDVANLTAGTGRAVLSELDTSAGEGLPGQFRLATVLDRIESFGRELSPVPVTAHWAINYPKKSAAVAECNAKGYWIENIPPDLFEKGSDDTTLQDKVWEVERLYPSVKHFVLVLGDRDYRIIVDSLLKSGKQVHIISRASALGRPDTIYSYDYLARQYPNHFTLHRLEKLLETGKGK